MAKTDRDDGLFTTVVTSRSGVALGLVYSSLEVRERERERERTGGGKGLGKGMGMCVFIRKRLM